MLDGFWYIAAESRLVRLGRLTATALANQSCWSATVREQCMPWRIGVLIGEFLSHLAAWMVNLSSVRIYHGWRFSTSEACLEAPVLGAGAAPKSACVRSYPVQEQDGRVWIYMGNEHV